MYDKVSANRNVVESEKAVEKFWKDNDVFKKSMEIREGCPTYMFYDGPPTANGKPHIGHVLTRVIKDMIPRYRTMDILYLVRQAGIHTDFLLSLRLRSCLVLTARSRLRNMVLSHLSSTVRKVYGNIRECGRISQRQ